MGRPQAAKYPSLSGLSVFVTGGASGIGEAVVRDFAAQGAKVAFVDIEAEKGAALAKEIAAAGDPEPFFQVCDIRDIEALRAAKTLGHPYDAEVTLKVHSKKLLRVLNKYAESLAGLFIVSKVSLGNAAPQDGLALTAEEVEVKASAAHKCARCWRRPGDVADEGGLCGRCADALKA